MLEVLLGLRRDIPISPFPLEFGDELPGCAHLVTIAGCRRGSQWTSHSYTASFSSFAGRKAIFLLALILMASPVAGFRPIRAARFRT